MEEDVHVYMENGNWKQLKDIQLGDVVMHSGEVLGTVRELCDETVNINGTIFGPGQLIHNGSKWVRASAAHESSVSHKVLRSLITSRCGTFLVKHGDNQQYVRDYREVANPDMENAYAAKFIAVH